MADVALRVVETEDLDLFFLHQTDAVANQVAAFGSKDWHDKSAFESRWKRILSDSNIVCRCVTVNSRVAGYVAHFEQMEKPSISYWIGRPFWGKGVATAAVQQFIQIVNVRPLFARVAISNLGSIKVLTKNGFRKIDTANSYSDAFEKMVEEAIYSLEHEKHV